MHDSVSGNHQIHGSCLDRLGNPKTVLMDDQTFEEISDRGYADVRMGPHLNAFSRREICWSHMIEEDERTNHSLCRRRQSASDREIAKILP